MGVVQGIDPDLAYLLPPDQRGVGGPSDPTAQTASFNARTGKFAVDNSYRFDHLDEYNRQKRMSEHYFDMEAWEKQRQEEYRKRKLEEAEGITHDSKITKQDMVRCFILDLVCRPRPFACPVLRGGCGRSVGLGLIA